MPIVDLSDLSNCGAIQLILPVSPSSFSNVRRLKAKEYDMTSTSLHVPICEFIDESDADKMFFSSDGCKATNATDSQIYCTCNHLTKFSSSHYEYAPKIEFTSEKEDRDISASTLGNHPAGIVAVIVIFVIGIFTFAGTRCSGKDFGDGDVLARKNFWEGCASIFFSLLLFCFFASTFAHARNRPQIFWELQSHRGRVLKIQEAKESFCDGFAKYFCFDFKNSNPILSLCLRHPGTNFSHGERVMAFMVAFMVCSFFLTLFLTLPLYSMHSLTRWLTLSFGRLIPNQRLWDSG